MSHHFSTTRLLLSPARTLLGHQVQSAGPVQHWRRTAILLPTSVLYFRREFGCRSCARRFLQTESGCCASLLPLVASCNALSCALMRLPRCRVLSSVSRALPSCFIPVGSWTAQAEGTIHGAHLPVRNCLRKS